MTRKNIIIITLSSLIVLIGCNETPRPQKYNIDKEKNIAHIHRTFKLYQTYKTHKAMAVAMDKEGKYVIGYSFDCNSTRSAKKIALTRCTHANTKALVKADVPCSIFALENNIVKALK